MCVSQLNNILFNWWVLVKNNYSLYYDNKVFNCMFYIWNDIITLGYGFIYEILKIIFFLQGSLKNLNFFEKKNNKFLNSHLIVKKWTTIFSN